MFDPNMMGMMNEMMSNPETMKKMEEMMSNPDFMNNAMNMMNNPTMASLFGNFSSQQNNEENNDHEREEDNNDIIQTENKFSENDVVTLVNLTSDSYNNQECIVNSFNNNSQRYNVYVKSLDKVISVKEQNIQLLNEEVIEVN